MDQERVTRSLYSQWGVTSADYKHSARYLVTGRRRCVDTDTFSYFILPASSPTSPPPPPRPHLPFLRISVFLWTIVNTGFRHLRRCLSINISELAPLFSAVRPSGDPKIYGGKFSNHSIKRRDRERGFKQGSLWTGKNPVSEIPAEILQRIQQSSALNRRNSLLKLFDPYSVSGLICPFCRRILTNPIEFHRIYLENPKYNRRMMNCNRNKSAGTSKNCQQHLYKED